MNAGTITGLAIGIHGTAMPNRAQGINASLHHRPPRLAIKRGYQANTAGVVFGQVEMRLTRKARGGCSISRYKSFVIRHGFDPSA
jgi:hypothetical protein